MLHTGFTNAAPSRWGGGHGVSRLLVAQRSTAAIRAFRETPRGGWALPPAIASPPSWRGA